MKTHWKVSENVPYSLLCPNDRKLFTFTHLHIISEPSVFTLQIHFSSCCSSCCRKVWQEKHCLIRWMAGIFRNCHLLIFTELCSHLLFYWCPVRSVGKIVWWWWMACCSIYRDHFIITKPSLLAFVRCHHSLIDKPICTFSFVLTQPHPICMQYLAMYWIHLLSKAIPYEIFIQLQSIWQDLFQW